jgi:hypothetical protein
MGVWKDDMIEKNETDSDNWRTWTCKYCGEKYKVNIVTGTNKHDDGYCPDCRNKLYSKE